MVIKKKKTIGERLSRGTFILSSIPWSVAGRRCDLPSTVHPPSPRVYTRVEDIP